MKKIVSLLIIAMAALTTVSAQNLGWSFGIKAGTNFATFEGDNVSKNATVRTGLVIGGFAENRMSDYFGLSADLLYSQQGAKLNEMTYKLDYLSIPILANFYIAEGLSLKAGLQPAFNLSTKGQIESVSVDLKGFNSFDLAIPIGISYQFNFGLLFDLRYNISATTIYKDSDIDSKNSVFQLTAGWRF